MALEAFHSPCTGTGNKVARVFLCLSTLVVTNECWDKTATKCLVANGLASSEQTGEINLGSSSPVLTAITQKARGHFRVRVPWTVDSYASPSAPIGSQTVFRTYEGNSRRWLVRASQQPAIVSRVWSAASAPAKRRKQS